MSSLIATYEQCLRIKISLNRDLGVCHFFREALFWLALIAGKPRGITPAWVKRAMPRHSSRFFAPKESSETERRTPWFLPVRLLRADLFSWLGVSDFPRARVAFRRQGTAHARGLCPAQEEARGTSRPNPVLLKVWHRPVRQL